MGSFTRNTRILYVDDEQGLLSAFASLMRKEGIETHLLQDSTTVEQVLEASGPFAVVLSDQRMPGLDGVGVLETVSRVHPETVKVMITGYADHADTLRAINLGGVSFYITKPWNDDELRRLTRECVDRYNLAAENRFLVEELKRSNLQLQELLDGTVAQTVRLLSDLIGSVSPEIAQRAERMRRLGKAILDVMPEVSPDERWETLRALDLSFLGIAALPSWIQVSLEKQGLAALDRFPAAKNHQLLGARLLKDIPRFAGVAAIIKLQGKDYNGYGEPLEEIIGGENLPLGSRLLRILHELERLTTPHFKGRAVLEQMLQYPAKFDTGLISRILQRQETRPQGESEREVLPDELRPGMVLVQDVLTRSDQCLLRAGATLIDTSITMLRQWHSKEPIEKKIAVRVAEQT